MNQTIFKASELFSNKKKKLERGEIKLMMWSQSSALLGRMEAPLCS